jgi:hypothetical protein
MTRLCDIGALFPSNLLAAYRDRESRYRLNLLTASSNKQLDTLTCGRSTPDRRSRVMIDSDINNAA